VSGKLLTKRQRECLALAREGKTSLQIAASLGLSYRTVNQHIGEACKRLKARNRAQAVAEAVLCGEI
jgi:DNA-binding CsgD family transcriptional regulator